MELQLPPSPGPGHAARRRARRLFPSLARSASAAPPRIPPGRLREAVQQGETDETGEGRAGGITVGTGNRLHVDSLGTGILKKTDLVNVRVESDPQLDCWGAKLARGASMCVCACVDERNILNCTQYGRSEYHTACERRASTKSSICSQLTFFLYILHAWCKCINVSS